MSASIHCPAPGSGFQSCWRLPAFLCVLWVGIEAQGTSWDWPQWHGPTRDCHVADGRIPSDFDAQAGPVWKISVGGGHSSPVVAGGFLVYTDEDGTNEVVHCLDARTGATRWKQPFAGRTEDEWGAGPRSTPAIDSGRVYVLSCNGEFRCLDLSDGRIHWGTSFEKDFGVRFLGYRANDGTASRRGNSGSVLVDGGDVIVPVGGTNGATLVCFDKQDGTERWRAGDDEAAYSSPVSMTLAGLRQVVYVSADAMMGVERVSGRVMWRVPLNTAAKRHAASPMPAGEDRVIVNSHTFGTRCYRIASKEGEFRAEEVWSNKDLKINLATPVLSGAAFYSQGPARDYVCFDAATGRLNWSQRGFGLGKRDYSSTLASGDKLLVLTEDGTLLFLRADPGKYTELGRTQVCGNTWSFPAYANGFLFVRDGRMLACYSLL